VDPGIGLSILSATFGSELLGLYGSEDQKQLVLPQLVSGQAIMGTAITEPDAAALYIGSTLQALHVLTLQLGHRYEAGSG